MARGVLDFRPVSSQFRVDHGFIQAASLAGSVFLSNASSGVNIPWVKWGRSALYYASHFPIPARTCDPVSKAFRYRLSRQAIHLNYWSEILRPPLNTPGGPNVPAIIA